ncbi:hypothetical protein CsSME_00031391 [Camellia sinensis var. sinensis]
MMPSTTNGADLNQQQQQQLWMQQQQIQQQQQIHHQQQQQQIQGSSDENRMIWIGDLQQWMDEGYINTCFAHTGEVNSVKVIRSKQTGQSEGYGAVETGANQRLPLVAGIVSDGDDSEEKARFCTSEEGSHQNRESEERETRI